MQLKLENIVRNEDNAIVSGSARLVKNSYSAATGKAGHSRTETVESFGKVLWIDDDRKDGIFLSRRRGLFEYSLLRDEYSEVDMSDPRLEGSRHRWIPNIHTNFGDSYLFFTLLEQTPFMKVLREAFPDRKQLKAVLAHQLHNCLKTRSSIKCGAFLARSVMTHILGDFPRSTLDSDTPYYGEMGKDETKARYFRTLVKHMREASPGFGRSAYVDSTPLPSEARDNPFNALCDHGTDGPCMQTRLALVLDIATGIPVWFDVFAGNVLDQCTFLRICRDVKATLDVDIDQADLDAGYAAKGLFEKFNLSNARIENGDGTSREHTMVVRMPAKPGFPHDALYLKCRQDFDNPAFFIDYGGHTYFAREFTEDVFGYPEHCHVYVDRYQAECGCRKWRIANREEWEALSEDDKYWYARKDGFFILVSNGEKDSLATLAEYRGRGKIEEKFKSMKHYLDCLPLAGWYPETICGKLLDDVISLVLHGVLLEKAAVCGEDVNSMIVALSGLGCTQISEDLIEINTPNKGQKDIFARLGMPVPGHLSLGGYRGEVLEGIPMDRAPLTMQKKPAGRKPSRVRHSPEEKQRLKEEKKKEREAERQARKEAKRMEKEKARAEKKAAKEREREAVRKAVKKERERARKAREKERNKKAGAARKKTAASKKETTG